MPRPIAPTKPRVLVVPDGIDHTVGDETVELCSEAGLELDPWQQHDVRLILSRRKDGMWAGPQAGLVVARQNGKGAVLEAIELCGLFIVETPLTLHTAHEFSTAREAALERLFPRIENNPWLTRKCAKPSLTPANMHVRTLRGPRVVFRTRTKGGGRGLSGETILIDEAYAAQISQMSALEHVMNAQENPLAVFASSAALADSEVLHALRRQALNDPGGRLTYIEYSPEYERKGVRFDAKNPDTWAPLFDPGSIESLAAANPSLGIRIKMETLQDRHRSAIARGTLKEFMTEVLSIPEPEKGRSAGWMVISEAGWSACEDEESGVVGNVALGVEVSPDRSKSAVGAAGRNADGKLHGEVIAVGDGTDWVIERVVELTSKWSDISVVAIDPASPAGSLIAGLEENGIDVKRVSAQEHAQATGQLIDAIANEQFAHPGEASLTEAVKHASTRPLGDSMAFDRGTKTDAPEVTELVAITLALGQVPGISDKDANVFAF